MQYLNKMVKNFIIEGFDTDEMIQSIEILHSANFEDQSLDNSLPDEMSQNIISDTHNKTIQISNKPGAKKNN